MREIKFRAWDGERMIDNWFNVAEKPAMTIGDISLPPYLSSSLNMASPLAVMQYTGLKDKNGKEIYEGDLLREIQELSEEDYQNRIGQVVYESNIASFMILVDGGYCHLNKGDWGRGDTLKFTEVIGNIYETPELLEHQSKE